jgi:hypothetical protein
LQIWQWRREVPPSRRHHDRPHPCRNKSGFDRVG